MDRDADRDRVVLLLSADWFRPFLRVFGLVLDEREESSLQQCARTAVRDLMAAAKEYWSTDLSDARRARTAQLLLTCVLREGRNAHDQLDAFIGAQRESVDAEETTLWLFDAITERLVSQQADSADAIDVSALKLIASAWQTASRDAPDEDALEKAALNSQTSWDKYLRSLTPDLPTYLSDYASSQLLWPSKFQRFWAVLSWTLSKEDRVNLLRWYVEEAKRVADQSFEAKLPVWLRA